MRLEDAENDRLETSWVPRIDIPGLKPEEVDYFSKVVLTGCLVSMPKGAWTVQDTWNQMLPEYHFTTVEEFLSKPSLVWET